MMTSTNTYLQLAEEIQHARVTLQSRHTIDESTLMDVVPSLGRASTALFQAETEALRAALQWASVAR
jgi:hypothetical protein